MPADELVYVISRRIEPEAHPGRPSQRDLAVKRSRQKALDYCKELAEVELKKHPDGEILPMSNGYEFLAKEWKDNIYFEYEEFALT
jgi:hypothetical protein